MDDRAENIKDGVAWCQAQTTASVKKQVDAHYEI